MNAKHEKYLAKYAGAKKTLPYGIEQAAERAAREAGKLAARLGKAPTAAMKKMEDAAAARTMAKQTPSKKQADAKPEEVPAADAKKSEPKGADAKADKPKKHALKKVMPTTVEEIPVMPTDTDGATPSQLAKMKELKRYEKSNHKFAKKINEVHLEWAKDHHGPPHSKAEQAEYAKLLKKIVGEVSPEVAHKKKINQFHAPDLNDQFKVAGGKAITSLAAAKHSEAEMKMAKVKALQDLEQHDPKIKTKIAEVHHQWIKEGHKAPPSTPAEEKEYHALMEKIVGHPDISFQLDPN